MRALSAPPGEKHLPGRKGEVACIKMGCIFACVELLKGPPSKRGRTFMYVCIQYCLVY